MSLHALRTPAPTSHGSSTGSGQTTRRHLGSVPRGSRDSGRTDDAQRTAESLSPWGSRERPATAAEEALFVERLRQMSARPSQGRVVNALFQRYDITAVVTALRNGVTVDEMFRSAPGLRPEAVAAAYDHVERVRRNAVDAWAELVAEPTAATLLDVGERAAALIPAVISRLRSLLVQHNPAVTLEDAIAAIDAEIQATCNRALELEYLLTNSANPALAARAAELLVGDLSDGLWSLGSFLPPRVGTFVSVRLREMLGEDATESDSFRAGARARSAVA